MRLYQDGGRSVVVGVVGVGVGVGVVVASLQHLNHELICVTGNVKYRTTSAT